MIKSVYATTLSISLNRVTEIKRTQIHEAFVNFCLSTFISTLAQEKKDKICKIFVYLNFAIYSSHLREQMFTTNKEKIQKNVCNGK